MLCNTSYFLYTPDKGCQGLAGLLQCHRVHLVNQRDMMVTRPGKRLHNYGKSPFSMAKS